MDGGGSEGSPGLAGVLQRLADHLDGLAEETLSLEESVSAALEEAEAQKTGDLVQLQRLDFLRQSLEDCALLTLLLSRNAIDTDIARLGLKLRLESTRSLLSPLPHRPAERTMRGEVDLF